MSHKIFIIGLPRTGTTSVCHAFLQLGYLTAHTCYTKACLAQAEVIADTPIYYDFEQLDALYPGSKFVYLNRDMALWLPSIKQLLQRMQHNLTRQDGGFNPHIKRCFLETFTPFTEHNIGQDGFLTDCYLRHQHYVESYFHHRENDLLSIDISAPESFAKLLAFINKESNIKGFEKLNMGGKVTAWNQIKHPNKVQSTHNGKIDKHIY
ncbi:sulfotransferase [Thalassotalea aquiviva]|uniref:sulfotransferase n=1 Tax=Thalassotalea aquiviva TaxID=3242415 RepID=UPI00352A76C7